MCVAPYAHAMDDVPRHVRVAREKGRALARAVHVSELQAAGAARALALHEAEQQLDRVARLLPDALEAGLSLSEISRITGVSRPTLYELRGRYGGSERDLTLAVLQAVASRGPLTMGELADWLSRDEAEVGRVVRAHIESDRMDWDPESRPGSVAVEITSRGLDALEGWEFVMDERDAAADAEDIQS